MPLTTERSFSEPNKGWLRNKLSSFSSRAHKTIINNTLEVILSMFILVNLFVDLRILLGLFIIFYFADRWEIKKLILKDKEITVVHQEAVPPDTKV